MDIKHLVIRNEGEIGKVFTTFFVTCVSPPLSLIQRVGGRLMHFNVEESFVFKVYLEEINICLIFKYIHIKRYTHMYINEKFELEK